MRATGRAMVAVPALAVLAATSWQAVRHGTGEARLYEASREVLTWNASRAEPGHATWGWVHERLEAAVAAIPRSAAARELIGELDMRRPDSQERLDEARDELTRALQLRPTSPYTWGTFAAAEYRRGDTGPAFEAALRNAAALGPSEPEVQRTVVDLGFAVYDEITPGTRSAVERMVDRGLRRNAAEILAIAERRGRLGMACGRVAGVPRQAESKAFQICEGRETKP